MTKEERAAWVQGWGEGRAFGRIVGAREALAEARAAARQGDDEYTIDRLKGIVTRAKKARTREYGKD